jgi:hypothetical protein
MAKNDSILRIHQWRYPKSSHFAMISSIIADYYTPFAMLFMQLRGKCIFNLCERSIDMKIILLLGFAILIGSVLLGVQHSKSQEQDMTDEMDKEINEKNAEKATFAGGCFWCTESDFEKIDGVLAVVSGYTGGDEENPTYEQVSYGRTGHYEAVQVLYDSEKITYSELLER